MSAFKIFVLVLCFNIEIMSTKNTLFSSSKRKFNKFPIQNHRQRHHNVDENNREIESKILDLLGLSKRPKRSKSYPSLSKSGPQYLLNIFENMNDDGIILDNSDDNMPRKTRSALKFLTDLDEMEIEKCNNIITFLNRDIPENKPSTTNTNFGIKLWFNVNQIPKELSLIKSELRIFQDPLKGIYKHTGWTFTITVYQIDSVNGNLKIISSVNTTAAYQGWLEIDLTSSFQQWILRPKENFGIVLKTEFHGEELLPQHIGLVDTGGDEQFQPFVVGFFNGPEIISKVQNFRIKREIKDSNSKTFDTSEIMDHRRFHDFEDFLAPKTCRRMNFSVDFRELNWNDWIIAPEKFDAFFCSGECNFPLGAGMNATNHALIQTLMHLKQPLLPKPCCAPVSLGSISVLYYLNEESVNLKKYKNMIVKSCGCH